jgi:hypothetical protein
MRAPPELVWTLVIVAPVTAAWLVVGAPGPPPARGLVGHGLGISGLGLMLFAWFGYSWRKRPGRTGPGSMQAWLTAHVVAGVIGPWLVLLHGAFSFDGFAGVLAVATVVVMASGFVGRYAFTRLPRAAAADAVERALLLEIRRMDALEDPSGHVHGTGLVAAAVGNERRVLEQQLSDLRSRRAEPAAGRLRRPLAVWWLLHVPGAAVVVALALVHIVAALYYATLLR